MTSKSLTIYEAAAAAVSVVILNFLIAITLFELGFNLKSGDPINSVITVVSVGIVISVLMKITNLSYKETFHLSNSSVLSTLSFLAIPVSLIVGSLAFWFIDLQWLMVNNLPQYADDLETLERMMSGGVVTLISICLVAPFLEEMLFRGLFLRGFLSYYSPALSIFYSSVLFSILHLNVYQIPVAFMMGCLLGWIYYVSRSLWPCILAHSFYNLIAYMDQVYDGYNGVVVNLVSFLVFLFGIYLIQKIYRVSFFKSH